MLRIAMRVILLDQQNLNVCAAVQVQRKLGKLYVCLGDDPAASNEHQALTLAADLKIGYIMLDDGAGNSFYQPPGSKTKTYNNNVMRPGDRFAPNGQGHLRGTLPAFNCPGVNEVCSN